MADESCDFAVVRALRGAGHDVIAVTEISPAIRDEIVLALAHDDKRVLLTEDTDFGELVYADGLGNSGVILFRFPTDARTAMVAAALDTVATIGNLLATRFTVVQPGRIRTGTGRH